MGTSGVSGRLVGPAAFKAVEASPARRLVGSIPIHLRGFDPYHVYRWRQ